MLVSAIGGCLLVLMPTRVHYALVEVFEQWSEAHSIIMYVLAVCRSLARCQYISQVLQHSIPAGLVVSKIVNLNNTSTQQPDAPRNQPNVLPICKHISLTGQHNSQVLQQISHAPFQMLDMTAWLENMALQHSRHYARWSTLLICHTAGTLAQQSGKPAEQSPTVSESW